MTTIKRMTVVLAVALLGLASMHAQDDKTYEDQFFKAFDADDFDKMRDVLVEWDAYAPSADMFSNWFTYYSLLAGKSGVNDQPDYSVQLPLADKLRTAVEMYPDRVDLRQSEMNVMINLERYNLLPDAVTDLLQHDTQINGKWLTYNNEPGTPERMGTAEEIAQDYFAAMYDYKQLDVARQIADNAIELRPTSVIFRTDQAVLMIADGDYAGAIEALQAIDDEQPGDEVVMSNLALLYEQMGDVENATKYNAKLLESTNETLRQQAQAALERLQ